MSELPPGWSWATIQDLAASEPRSITDGPFGSNLKSAHYTDSGPRVVRLQNIGDGHFVDAQAHISREHFAAFASHSVRANDLLIAGLGENLPRACLAPSSLGDAIVKADCFRVRLHPALQPRYVCAILNSPQVRAAASQRVSGVGRPRLNLKKVREIAIQVPPVAEQDRIAAAIEEQFSRLDAGVAALERARQNLKRMQAAVLHAAVTGRLVPQDPADGRAADQVRLLPDRRRFTKGLAPPVLQGHELPENWTTAYLEDLADRVTVGYVGPMQTEYVAEGVPFLRSQNVRANRFAPDGLKFIGRQFHRRIIKSRLLPGDVVIVRSGDVGTACVIPEALGEGNCSDLVVIQRPQGIESQFAAYYMNSIGQRYVRAGQVGVALTHFNTKSVAALPIPVPPLREQRRIVAEADRLLSIIRDMESVLRRVEALAAQSRSSILSSAYSGGLVPQDPNDEPASALLDRICAERADSAGRKSTSKGTRRRKTAA